MNARTDWLAREAENPHLSVPCSRYGRTAGDCLPWALLLADIFAAETGEPETVEGLDGCMSLVVNDHDDVDELVIDHGADHLDTPQRRALFAEAVERAAERQGRLDDEVSA